MNAPASFAARQPAGMPSEPEEGGHCLQYVWESRFGAILIEVVGDEIFVNGSRVAPFRPAVVGPRQEPKPEPRDTPEGDPVGPPSRQAA